MTSVRKAKKLKLKDYQETGYRLRWKCSPEIPPSPALNKWHDNVISLVEEHGLLFCGSMNPSGGSGVVYKGEFQKTPLPSIESLILSLSSLPGFVSPEVIGPFDLNRGPLPLFPDES